MPTTNILQQVITYQESELAQLLNMNAFISNANKKFENFHAANTTNLGSTVNIEKPYLFNSASGLLAVDQAIEQRYHPLTVDQSANVSMVVTNPDQIFNLDKNEYMTKIGKGAAAALAAEMEKNVAANAHSAVAVMIPDPLDPSRYIPSGAYHTESGPYRFYGDGTTAINSYQQFAQMVANFSEVGVPAGELEIYIPNTMVPAVIGSGLSQFVPKRNDEIAMTWDIGEFGTPSARYYQSNNLPTHTSGTVGDTVAPNNILTVITTNDPTGAAITSLHCSGAGASDPNAIKMGDVIEFIPTTTYGCPVYVTTYGKNPTSQVVQFRATANAGSDGSGHVDVSVFPTLVATAGGNQNIDKNIIAGMRIRPQKSHKCGLLVAGKALYISMPRLPDQHPFPTSNSFDPDTGASIRLTYGSVGVGGNKQRLVHDTIWASTIVPEYSMRLLLPL